MSPSFAVPFVLLDTCLAIQTQRFSNRQVRPLWRHLLGAQGSESRSQVYFSAFSVVMPEKSVEWGICGCTCTFNTRVRHEPRVYHAVMRPSSHLLFVVRDAIFQSITTFSQSEKNTFDFFEFAENCINQLEVTKAASTR